MKVQTAYFLEFKSGKKYFTTIDEAKNFLNSKGLKKYIYSFVFFEYEQ